MTYLLEDISIETPEPLCIFHEKVRIKDDKVVHCSNLEQNNLQIYDTKMIATQNNMIFINIDDEIKIQSMHTMLFAKKEIALNCCATEYELVSLLMQIYSDQNWLKDNQPKPKIVVLLDHILDGQKGIDVQRKAKVTQDRFNLDIMWVLVSSTEDVETINTYKRAGVKIFIEKPLSKKKLDLLLSNLD